MENELIGICYTFDKELPIKNKRFTFVKITKKVYENLDKDFSYNSHF